MNATKLLTSVSTAAFLANVVPVNAQTPFHQFNQAPITKNDQTPVNEATPQKVQVHLNGHPTTLEIISRFRSQRNGARVYHQPMEVAPNQRNDEYMPRATLTDTPLCAATVRVRPDEVTENNPQGTLYLKFKTKTDRPEDYARWQLAVTALKAQKDTNTVFETVPARGPNHVLSYAWVKFPASIKTGPTNEAAYNKALDHNKKRRDQLMSTCATVVVDEEVSPDLGAKICKDLGICAPNNQLPSPPPPPSEAQLPKGPLVIPHQQNGHTVLRVQPAEIPTDKGGVPINNKIFNTTDICPRVGEVNAVTLRQHNLTPFRPDQVRQTRCRQHRCDR